MKTVTGVFTTSADAGRVAQKLRAIGLSQKNVALLLPGNGHNQPGSIPVTATEQSGMGKAIGGLVGAAAGAAGGLELGTAVSAVIPGVGPVVAIGLFGAALLGAAGAGLGGMIGQEVESVTMEGVPEDELFVYEDALRNGRSVVIAMTEDNAAPSVRNLLQQEGAESVDAAREKWWIGLRSAEREHYSRSGGDFDKNEKFYRLGFQAAVQARTRGKEYDQVLTDMQEDLEVLKRQCPNPKDVEKAFERGYERGRAYYESTRKGPGQQRRT
jgi:hypothetical protein